jgi:hypothetical protein
MRNILAFVVTGGTAHFRTKANAVSDHQVEQLLSAIRDRIRQPSNLDTTEFDLRSVNVGSTIRTAMALSVHPRVLRVNSFTSQADGSLCIVMLLYPGAATCLRTVGKTYLEEYLLWSGWKLLAFTKNIIKYSHIWKLYEEPFDICRRETHMADIHFIIAAGDKYKCLR